MAANSNVQMTTLVYDYNTQFGDTPLTPYQKSFNTAWVDFDVVPSADTVKYGQGCRSIINYYPGGATARPVEYHSHHTVAELAAIANGGTNS